MHRRELEKVDRTEEKYILQAIILVLVGIIVFGSIISSASFSYLAEANKVLTDTNQDLVYENRELSNREFEYNNKNNFPDSIQEFNLTEL